MTVLHFTFQKSVNYFYSKFKHAFLLVTLQLNEAYKLLVIRTIGFSTTHFFHVLIFLKMKKTLTLIVFNLFVIGLFGQAEKHRLDSIVRFSVTAGQFDNFSKDLYTYDDSGNNTQNVSYWTDATGAWLYRSKGTYTYDTAGNEILSISHSWDTINQQWIEHRKHEITYDANGNETLRVRYIWDENTEAWRGWKRYERAYDADDNETLILTYIWDNTTNNWIEHIKNEDVYTGGYLTENVIYNWDEDAGQWIGYRKKEYAYDAEGNLIADIKYDWSTDTQAWINDYKTETLYTNGSITSTMYYDWIAGEWINKSISEYAYNPEKQLVELTEYWLGDLVRKQEYDYDNAGNQTLTASHSEWNATTQQWGNGTKTEYTYDDNNNLTSRIGFDWDAGTQAWNPTAREDGGYGEFTLDELIMPEHLYNFLVSFNISNNQTYGEAYMRDETNQTWELTYRSDYYYSSVLTAIENTYQTKLHIFPNPTSDIITFDLENSTFVTLSIYDVQGKYMGTQHLQNNQLSVRHLDSGVYFYQLLIDGEIFGGKFIVK